MVEALKGSSKCQSQSSCPRFSKFFRVPSSYIDNAIQSFVSTTRTNRHSNLTIRPPPTLLLHIPDRQVVPRQSDGHPLSFTRTDFRVREPTENRGGLSRGRREIYIELWDLGNIVKINLKNKKVCGEIQLYLTTEHRTGILQPKADLICWPAQPERS